MRNKMTLEAMEALLPLLRMLRLFSLFLHGKMAEQASPRTRNLSPTTRNLRLEAAMVNKAVVEAATAVEAVVMEEQKMGKSISFVYRYIS